MDAHHLLHAEAKQRLAIPPVGEVRGKSADGPHGVGPREHARAKFDPGLAPANGIGAHQEAGEIELELVLVVRRVRALDVAEFALVAEIVDLPGLG